MIRIISVAALTLLLVFVLYLPAANPPERFLAQIRSEHATNASFWGEARAELILERALTMNQALSAASPIPSDAQAPATDRMAQAVAQEMERVNQRFFGNTYFRSIDSLLLLATFRLAALFEWLPVQVFIVLAMVIDGLIVRVLRSKEFKPHDPEWFALHACALVLLACTSIVAFVVPMTIAPTMLAAVPIVGTLFLSRVVANFHRRG
ncbi:DUF4400 domain-containing protein [Ottowia sp.]|uniref:DUF4400 domain-containing protein n=1 Tax=Ottowia sp. TaxID=1898956 RepID=UPI00260B073F|nr:DUF4400 domain-containing protein [Ottowia sp.]